MSSADTAHIEGALIEGAHIDAKTQRASTPRRLIDRHRWLLALILLLAFALRAWNLDWDRGTHLHPDERFWSDVAANVQNPDQWTASEVLDPERSPLNPRVYKDNYVYGTLPLWASEAAAAVLMTDFMAPVTSGLDAIGINLLHDRDGPVGERLRFNTGYDVTIVGRLMSALVDTATVLVVFALGAALMGRRAGLLAALLQALTVLHIQYSHFLGSEPWVAFFVASAVLGSVRLARGQGGWPTRLLTALALGCAIGSKLNGVAAFAAPMVAALVVAWPHLDSLRQRSEIRSGFRSLFRSVEPWIVMALASVVAYRVVQPYDFQAGLSLIFNAEFEKDIAYLSDVNQGGNWPWVQPLVGKTPLWHPLKQLFLWGMGPGLALAALAGCVRAAMRIRRGEHYWAIPLAVVAAYLVLVTFQFYAIVRYLQPAYPVLAALAGCGLVALWRSATAEQLRPELARLIRGLVVLSVGATVFWGLAFANGVYGNDNARMAAGDWMLDNLPPTAAVTVQEWDDGLPWGQPSEFEYIVLRPFSFVGDTTEGITNLIDGLDATDYVIESSNKFYDALPLTPARFPQITTYYERLFDGSLGFELLATFQNQPSLLGLTIDDSRAEEAFTVYDHPTVYIWRKTSQFSRDRATQLLNPDRARTAINAVPKDAYANAAMLRPASYEAQQSGDGFDAVHHNESSGLGAAVSWYAILQIAAFASIPVVAKLAGRSAGVAYGYSKVIGLLAFAMPVWLIVSFGLATFSTRLIGFVLLVLVCGGVVMARRNAKELVAVWHAHRRIMWQAELIFTLAFLAVLALRALNPDSWHPWQGGEKPMELAYLTAVTGSTTLPPYDPWFAGGALNYYYGGWFMLAVPAKLLGLLPAVTFNLGVATYAALAVVTVFATAAVLADLAHRQTGRRLSPARAGLLTAVLFAVVGNLDAFRQAIRRLREDLPLVDFDWWDPSRVNKNSAGFEVTEFPSFTILFADLHPHFMNMTFFGLMLGLAVFVVERSRRSQPVIVLVAAMGALTAVVRMVHTWDLPAVGAIGGASIIIGAIIGTGPRWWRVRDAFIRLVAFGVAHLVVSAPYRSNNQATDTGVHRAESQTNLDDWIAHWGVFLFVGAAYLVVRLTQLFAARTMTSIVAAPAILCGFVGIHLLVGSVAAWAFVGLSLAASVLLFEIGRQQVSTAHTIVAACWLLGFAVLVAVEIFTFNADIARLNTVFKFWLQVWHLFAVATAFSAMWLLSEVVQHRTSTPVRDRVGSALTIDWALVRPRLQQGFRVGFSLLLVAAMAYPVLAVLPRQAARVDSTLGPSLDGTIWLKPGVVEVGVRDLRDNEHRVDPSEDLALIEWLRRVEGRPTIVEGVGPLYQWWSRMSINTGLPAVVGWQWHQEQQRGIFSGKVGERIRDVDALYQTTDPAEVTRFLRTYDVEFVVVGTLERASANPATLELFRTHPALVEVFSGERGLAIYGVANESLAQASGAIASIGPG